MPTTIIAPPDFDAPQFAMRTGKEVPVCIGCDFSPSMDAIATDSKGIAMSKLEGMKHALIGGLDYMLNDPMLRESVRYCRADFATEFVSTGFNKLSEETEFPGDLGRGTALNRALEKICDIIESYFYTRNEDGISPTQCTFLLMTDGRAGDGPCDASMERLLGLQRQGLVNPIAAGMNEEDERYLKSLGFEQVYRLDQLSWQEIIQLATVSAKKLAGGQLASSIDMVGGKD